MKYLEFQLCYPLDAQKYPLIEKLTIHHKELVMLRIEIYSNYTSK